MEKGRGAGQHKPFGRGREEGRAPKHTTFTTITFQRATNYLGEF